MTDACMHYTSVRDALW